MDRAHWYLAVICFPGLEGPVYEKNPLYLDPTLAPGPAVEPQSEENIPDHCRPLSPDLDGLDDLSDHPEEPAEADCDPRSENPEGAQEAGGQTRAEAEQQYSSECPQTVGGADVVWVVLCEAVCVVVCLQASCTESVFVTAQEETTTPSPSLTTRAPVRYCCLLLLPLIPPAPSWSCEADAVCLCVCVCAQDECSDDGALTEDASDVSSLASKPTVCRQ